MKKTIILITQSIFVFTLLMITSCEKEDITQEIQEIETISENSLISKASAPSSEEVVLPYIRRRGASRLSATVVDGNQLEVQVVRPRPRNDAREVFFEREIIINGRAISRRGIRVALTNLREGPRFRETSTTKRTLSNLRFTDGTPVRQINSFEVVVTYSLANSGFGGPRRFLVVRTNVPLGSN